MSYTWAKVGGDGVNSSWDEGYNAAYSLAVLGTKLYAGLGYGTGDAEVWECTPGGAWTKIGGDEVNSSWSSSIKNVHSLTVLGTKLYAGIGRLTGDAEVWECTPGGAWTKIGGSSVNSSWDTNYGSVYSLTVLGTKLYAGLGRLTGHAEVWECTPGGAWTKIGGDGVNSSWDTDYEDVFSLTVLGTKLYAGLGSGTGDAEVWECTPGGAWTKIGGDGVNSSWDTDYERIRSLTTLGTKLYAGLGSGTGDAEVWECTPGGAWTKIGGDGVNSSWDTNYEYVYSLTVFGTKLYAGLGSGTGDAEVWECTPGGAWTKIGGDGVNSSWDTNYEYVLSLTVLGTKLYAGLGTSTGDAEVWEMTILESTTDSVNGNLLIWEPQENSANGNLNIWGSPTDKVNGHLTIHEPQTDSVNGNLIITGWYGSDKVNGNLFVWEPQTNSANGNLNICNQATDSVNGNLNICNQATDAANGNLFIWEPQTDSANGNLNICNQATDSVNGNLNICNQATDAANGNLFIWEPQTDSANGYLNIFTSAIGDWAKVGGDGVNSSWVSGYERVHFLTVLGTKLYGGLGASTGDAEVWEYDPGTTTWAKVGGDGVNSSWNTDYEYVFSLTVLGTKLYAGLGASTGDAEVWEYTPGTTTWAKIGGDEVNSSWNTGYKSVYSLTALGTKLYAGLGNTAGDAEVWEYTPGTTTWAKVGGDGVNSSWDTDYEYVLSLTVLGTKLYAGLGASTGDAEVWEYTPGTTTWAKIGGDGVNSSWNTGYESVYSLTALGTKLYAGLSSDSGDAEVWEYTPGTTTWAKIGGDEVNSSWTANYEYVFSLTVFDSKLYAGLGNNTGDAEVWELTLSTTDTINGNLNICNQATDSANGNLFIWQPQTDAANGNLNICNHTTDTVNGNLIICDPVTDSANGNLFIWEPQTDSVNGWLNIFTSAIGDWAKIGGDGVNSSWNTDYEYVLSLTVLGTKLYAGLGNDTGDAEVWEYTPGTTTWAKVGGDGVNSSWNTDYKYVFSLTVLGTKLYAGLGASTGDAEVWEYTPGTTTWAKIGGDGVNSSWNTDYEYVLSLTVLGTKLYAGLGASTGDAEVWEYTPGTTTWAKVGGDGVNSSWDTDYEYVLSLTALGTKLYAGLGASTGDAEVWEYTPGTTTWAKVGGDGVNSSWGSGYLRIQVLTVFGTKLYAGLGSGIGDAEVWEYTPGTTTWTKIGGDGVNSSWNTDYESVFFLTVFDSKLYAGLGSGIGDAEVWEYTPGTTTWAKIGGDEVNSSWGSGYERVQVLTVLGTKLYGGLGASSGDAEVWELTLSTTDTINGNLNICNQATDAANGNLFIWETQTDSANGNLNIRNYTTDSANGNLNICNHTTDSVNGNLNICNQATDAANGNLFIWEPQTDSANGNLFIWRPQTDSINGNLIITGYGYDAVNGNLTVLGVPTDDANGWLRIETPTAVTNPSANVQFWNAAKTAEVLQLDQVIELAAATDVVELWFYNDQAATQSPAYDIKSIYIGNRCANRQYIGQTAPAGQEQIDEKWMELRSTEADGCTPDNQSAWTPVGGDTITGALLAIGDIPFGAGRKIELRFNVPGGADSEISVSQIYVCLAEEII